MSSRGPFRSMPAETSPSLQLPRRRGGCRRPSPAQLNSNRQGTVLPVNHSSPPLSWQLTRLLGGAPVSFIGERIRSERKTAGLSLSQMAVTTGLSKTYLIRLETDPSSNPSLGVLRQIADALDITVADLLDRPKLQFDETVPETPPSLRAFADQAALSQADVRTLASIRWRQGDEPQTVERWRYVYDSLVLSRHLDGPGNAESR
jgi:transcriptional regulator with XRE-family HTH domain